MLDVGCGNNSPYYVKSILPNIFYTGIDIGDYNQKKPNLADKYIITKPEQFADAIAGMENSFDTIISSHNLEHCDDREKALNAMLKALKSGGCLFLSFPTEKSIKFPHRKGTLNYYDDSTHKYRPPEYEKIINTLQINDMDILFASNSYKPIIAYFIGLLLEPISKIKKKVLYYSYGTWAYWGFETIIWARKK